MSEVVFTSAEATTQAGVALGAMLQAGDVVILGGQLGAGKTTFTRGIAQGMGVRGEATSPTFVIARAHPSLAEGPRLVHVDVYRVQNSAAIADLDLEMDLEDAALVIEWGDQVAEFLSDDRLHLWFERANGDTRRIRTSSVGERWSAVDVAALLAHAADGAPGDTVVS